MYFEHPVDRRSRKAMIEFLAAHGRYAASAGNRGSTYAHCIKFYKLGLTNTQQDAAWNLLSSDENYWEHLETHIAEFTRRHNGDYTIGTNGRSSGYLILLDSHYEDTGYKSICRTCGQRNYRRVATLPADPVERAIAQCMLDSAVTLTDTAYLGQAAIRALAVADEDKLAILRRLRPMLKDCTRDNRCGHCGATGEKGRVNLTHPAMRLSVTAKAIDEHTDFSEWSMSDLRARVDLVCDFDKTCDTIREHFIAMCDTCEVVEETILVPKTVRRIVCAEHTA